MTGEFEDPDPETFWGRQAVLFVTSMLYGLVWSCVLFGPLVLYVGPSTSFAELSIIERVAFGLVGIVAIAWAWYEVGDSPFVQLRKWMVERFLEEGSP